MGGREHGAQRRLSLERPERERCSLVLLSAYSKNAHPGIRWEIPIVIQGGAWPFLYEITDDGGATGLRIGGELARSEEGEMILHRVTEDYGVLSWDDPQLGTYGMMLRVTDQEGATIDVPISLTVGTDGWVFVDADAGNDANDGSQMSPFATLDALYGAERSPYAEHRVYLAGLVQMHGNRPNGNLRIAAAPSTEADLAPRIWVGLPGGDAILEAFEGKFVLDAPDFYLANLEHRHHEDFFQDDDSFIHMITAFQNTARFVMHDVTISRFQGRAVNTGLGNSSVVMLTRGAPRFHVAIVGCTVTGPAGILSSTYSLRHAVFEKNRVVDAEVGVIDGSVPAWLYIKGGNEWVTVRANEMWERNTWGAISGIGLLGARNVELSHNVVDSPFDERRSGALRLWTNSPSASSEWTDDTPVWLDRNSLRRRIVWEGTRLENMPDGTVRIERNIVEPTAVAEDPRIINTENLEGDALLDENLRLMGEARDMFLGLRGAEIAAPR